MKLKMHDHETEALRTNLKILFNLNRKKQFKSGENRIFNSRLLNSATTFLASSRPRMAIISSSSTGNRATFMPIYVSWRFAFSLTPWRSGSAEALAGLRIPKEQLERLLPRELHWLSEILVLDVVGIVVLIHLDATPNTLLLSLSVLI